MEAFRVDRKVRTSGFGMPSSHFHDVCELYYLISGRCRMFVGHQLHYIEAGEIMLLAPGTLHRATYPDQGTAERITINFPAEALDSMAQVCGQEVMGRLFSEERISVPLPVRTGLEVLLLKMEEEVKAGDGLSLFLAKNRLYEIFALMLRYRIEGNRKQVGETEGYIQQAAMYICQNFEKPLTLMEMADMVHMTPTYFSRKFKQVTGFGFKEYLTYVRIAQAEKLLAGTSRPVTEIAMVCGFGDGNYFGDAFKKVKGISPRSYRQQTRIT